MTNKQSEPGPKRRVFTVQFRQEAVQLVARVGGQPPYHTRENSVGRTQPL